MIEPLNGLPDGVISFEISGKLHADDYRQTLIPAVEQAATAFALVTEVDWMRHLVSLFGWMTPGEVKHFPLAQRDAAIAWAAS